MTVKVAHDVKELRRGVMVNCCSLKLIPDNEDERDANKTDAQAIDKCLSLSRSQPRKRFMPGRSFARMETDNEADNRPKTEHCESPTASQKTI